MQYQKLGSEIAGSFDRTDVDKDYVLDLIARQYQYGANARPFAQINNSLFMELANMQIKLLGYEGMTHAQMDIVAQRIQPKAFSKYFIDRVKGVMP